MFADSALWYEVDFALIEKYFLVFTNESDGREEVISSLFPWKSIIIALCGFYLNCAKAGAAHRN